MKFLSHLTPTLRVVLFPALLTSFNAFAYGASVISNFESSEGFTVGAFTTFGQWTVSSGSAEITANARASGQQSLRLNPGGVAQENVSGTTANGIGFIDLFIKPSAASSPQATTQLSTQQMQIRFLLAENRLKLEYYHGDGFGGGQWTSTTLSFDTSSDGISLNWIRISAREDYFYHQWDLFVNGALIACRIPAPNKTIVAPLHLTILAATSGPTDIDDVYSGPDNPIYADANRNGIDDAWEQRWGFSLRCDNRNADPNCNGVLNIEEFLHGTDPTAITNSSTDTDHDGLADVWELQWTGSLTAISSPNADLDGDGISNYQAWLNGSSPSAPFTNFDFEQGITGWNVDRAGLTSNAFQGTRALDMSPPGANWVYNVTSLPFIARAGTNILSAAILGDLAGDVAVVNSTSGATIASIGKTIGSWSVWEPCATTFTLPSDTVVYLRISDGSSSGSLAVDDIRVVPVQIASPNYDFEQGSTGWWSFGLGNQFQNTVSNNQHAIQGSTAYQTSIASGTPTSSEEAAMSILYSPVFVLTPGDKLLSSQLFGTMDSRTTVCVVNADTGAEIARIQRLKTGPTWEPCYTTFNISTNTSAVLRIVDKSTTTHIAVDDLFVGDYVFNNFGFEQGMAGWSSSKAGITATAYEGTQALDMSPPGASWVYNVTSLPFVARAGTGVLSAQLLGDRAGGVALVNATTGSTIASCGKAISSWSQWEPSSASYNLTTDTLVYLRAEDFSSGGTLIVDDIRLSTAVQATAPTFNQNPADTTVAVGASVILTASASGYPTPAIQWIHDGAPVPGATSSTLAIASARQSDSGTYVVVARNQAGIASSHPAILTVIVDTMPPVLTIPSNVVAEASGPSGVVVNYTADAIDAVDGVVPVTYSMQPGRLFPLGTTLVTITARDRSGNTAVGTFTVTVRDTTAPTISIPNDILLEAVSRNGAVAQFTAVATDAVSSPVVTYDHTPGTLFPLGTTTVTATATDAAGNEAHASFAITVRDSIAPTLTLPVSQIIEATGPTGGRSGFVAYAYDVVDGTIPVEYSSQPGSVFPVGTTIVTVTARDTTGNVASDTFTITVRDSTRPVLAVPAGLTVEASEANGATVILSGFAVDLVDKLVPVTFSPTSGSSFGIGSTSVTATAIDSAGNVGSANFVVKVIDTTPPLITVPGHIVLDASSAEGAQVIYPCSAYDLVSGQCSVTPSIPSGARFPIGTTIVTVTATDTAGNVANANFKVTILPLP